ncbi:MAG: hypothetical protein H0X24_19200 [Ktedonobacterales bacterium]|jgi:hypothetical protein|nr:hypothetical protein [Ktedonobacterales bacterium]
MNAYEQFLSIRDRLEMNGASEDSIDLIDKYIDRAESERDSNTSITTAMVLKHLLRQREVLGNDAVYNDLQELMGEDPRPRNDDAAPYAYEEEHKPRPHAYYKQLKKEKEKERK